MAAIFFDGFHANRPRNEGQWGYLLSAAETPDPLGYGDTTKRRNPTSANSGAQKLSAFFGVDGEDQKAVKCFFGEQSGKKLYFGFGISGWQTFPTGRSPQDVDFDTLSDTDRQLNFVQLFNAADELVLSISLGVNAADVSGGVVQALRLYVNEYTADTFKVPADTVNSVAAVTVNSGGFDQTTYVVSETAENNDFIYFEFELDLTNSAENGNTTLFSCRVNDQPIARVGDVNVDRVPLDAPIANVSSLKLRGGYTADMYFDDLYVVDDTDTHTNSFLGRNTFVLSFDLDHTTPAQNDWTIVDPDGNSDPTLNVIDDDKYLTTSEFDKVAAFNLVSPSIPEGASIGAVMLTSYAKRTSLPAKYAHVYRETDGTIHDLGAAKEVTNLSYNCADQVAAGNLCSIPHTTIIGNDPSDTAIWALSDLSSGAFGVQSRNPAS